MLTPEQDAELRRCEAILDKHMTSGSAEKGAALRDIRDGRLYDGYESFEAYCLARWGIGRAYAYRLIEHAEMTKNVSPMGDTLPNERQSRAMRGLSAEHQREAWREAIETAPNGKVTAAHVASVAERYREPPAGIPQDEEGEAGWHMFEELRAVRDAVLDIAERWPTDKLGVLANKLIGLGRELIDNGNIS